MQILKTVFKKKKSYVIKSHENDNNNNDNFKYMCTITVFLLIRLFYLFIHSLNYLFKFIQILTVFTNLINLIIMSSSIACCLLNSSLKLTLSQCLFHLL